MTGRRAVFARLGKCDLNCTWCDTPYTWNWDRYNPNTELVTIDTSQVLERLLELAGEHPPGLVITGGEPLLQRRAVVDLSVSWLAHGGQWVQIETNGRHRPPDGLPPQVMIVASPKLANSGVDPALAERPESIRALIKWGTSFKFPVATSSCLAEVDRWVAEHGMPPESVWLMPVTDPDVHLPGRIDDPDLAQHALDQGFNYSTRLHQHLWGNTRAR